MALVFANCNAHLANGTLNLDEAWDDNDPLVKARPELFNAEPTIVRGQRKQADPPVEKATAAPGEKRTTKRA